MKIKPDNFENYVLNNYEKKTLIFIYGPNLGLTDLLYNKTIKLFNVNMGDPFNTTKINGIQFKENPSILEDNINTLNIFSEKKFILLDLSHLLVNKNIENIILNAVTRVDVGYLLIIKAGDIGSKSKLVKHFEKSNNSILTACYEENTDKIKNDINDLLQRHDLLFSKDFISKLSSLFNSDSLTNKMEIDKLDNFLINNKIVNENSLINFIMGIEDIKLNKVINSCSSGEIKKALYYLEKIYDKSSNNIILIRMFVKHFKIIEKILLSNKHGKDFLEAINDLQPPIFFKEKPFILSQCKLWSLKKINLIQKRLIDLELKSKIGLYPEKTLLSQFILSTSVLAKKKN